MNKAHFIKSLFIFIGVAIAVTGCAATGPSYTSVKSAIPQLQSDQARLYFIREGGFMNSGLTARVHLNGTKMVDLNMNGFAYADRPAGLVHIMIDAPLNTGDARQSINIQSGETHYFMVANNSRNVMAGAYGGLLGALAEGGGRFVFAQISEAAALEQLKTKKKSGG